MKWQNVPPYLRETDIGKLPLAAKQIEDALKWQNSDADQDDYRPGLLPFGKNSGTGKTRTSLIVAAKSVMWNGEDYEREKRNPEGEFSGLWYSVGKFAQQYSEVARDMAAKSKWLKQMMVADTLVLDDIDKIRPTEGMLEFLFAVLDHRLNQKYEPTILTTNLVGEELAERWGPEYGPYLVRRIRERCLALDFDMEAQPSNVVQIDAANPLLPKDDREQSKPGKSGDVLAAKSKLN